MPREPHLLSVIATDTPAGTSANDAGKLPVLGDTGRLDSAFLQEILEAIADLASNGIICRTSATTVAARTLTAPAAGITVSNGNGVSGNPTLALANDLAALEGLASTGIAVRTGSDAWAQRTITGTAPISVANGNGVSGNPAISFTVPGANTQVIFNDGGALAGDAGFVYNKTTDTATVGILSSSFVGSPTGAAEFFGTIGGVNKAFRINVAGLPQYIDGGSTHTIWHSGNDGAGSGLDADLLDAQSGAFYLARGNHTGTQTLATISDAGTAAAQNTGTSGANLPFLNGTNTWGGTNLFQLDTDANYVLEVKNVDTGTISAAVLRSTSDSAVVSLITHAAARTVTRCGQTLGDWAELLVGSTSSGLLIDTNGSAPIKFGTNNTLAMTIDTSQVSTFTKLATTTYTVATLPTGAAGMLAFVTDATATTFASVVAGGGANGVPVYHDGTNWRIG